MEYKLTQAYDVTIHYLSKEDFDNNKSPWFSEIQVHHKDEIQEYIKEVIGEDKIIMKLIVKPFEYYIYNKEQT